MKLHPGHIVLLVLAVLLWASCKPHPKRISQKDMVEIYAQMFFQDQMVRKDPVLRKKADTSLVYEGIFRKYGYNTDDYLYSVEYYLKDPERMAKIMDRVAGKMNEAGRAMNEEVELFEWRQEMLALYFKPVSTLLPQPILAVDTLRVVKDSTESPFFFRFRPDALPVLDTLVLWPDAPVLDTSALEMPESEPIKEKPPVEAKDKMKMIPEE